MSALFDAVVQGAFKISPSHPYTERVIQMLLPEWAYAAPYRTSLNRSLALRPYLAYYNTQRPHTALHFQPPASRLASGTTS